MENLTLEISTKTNSADILYFVDFCVESVNRVSAHIDKEKFDELCLTGCPNFNKKWSCPPYAPSFLDFTKNWETLCVLYAYTNMSQFAYIKNDYLKIKAANVILKSRIDGFLRQISSKYGNYISTGSCRLCKPCKCKLQLPCKRPVKMTYSFEAMGVNVGSLVDEFFQKPLLWYSQNNLPEYTSVVCGLLTNLKITENNLRDEYLRFTKIFNKPSS